MIKLAKLTLSVLILILPSILISFFICLHIGIISFVAFVFKLFDWQVCIYFFIWFYVIYYLWKISFSKKVFWKKVLLMGTIVALTLSHSIIINFFPTVRTIIEVDYCADRGGAWDKGNQQCVEIQ